MNVKELIRQIEEHTGKPFDAKNPRHTHHLQTKIENFYADDLRKLALMRSAFNSKDSEDSLYNSRVQYAKNRFRD